MNHANHADAAVSLLLEHVTSLHGAAHSDEVAHTPAEREAVKVALAAGLVHRQGRSLLAAPDTDHRTVVARSFRGRLTCASAAEVLGYPVLHPPESAARGSRVSARSTFSWKGGSSLR